MQSDSYIICKKCVVDNLAYPCIKLDSEGVCDICHIYENLNKESMRSNPTKRFKLEEQIDKIKRYKNNKSEYNCLIGVSGGVDSAYLCIKAKEWGLKPILLHVDNGWNSELAVYNIEKIVDYTGFDLYTYVVNWTELRDIVKAYLYASVVDIDIANEMPIQAMLYEIARKFNVKYILTGHNNVSEGWMPLNVSHYKIDTINLRAIHKRFGRIKLKTYPMIGPLKTYVYEKILKLQFVPPLNLMNYNKNEAKAQLKELFNWTDYGDKHHENIFTRFYQAYILPVKFNIDKRKFHFSNLILAGQLSRELVIEILKTTHYRTPEMLSDDFEFVLKKLKIKNEEFNSIMANPPKSHTDYPSYLNIYKKVKPFFKFFRG